MLIKVMYRADTDSTEKIAVAIATATGIRPEAITDHSSVKQADLMFISDGANGKKPDDVMTAFIDTLDASKIKLVGVYGTYHSNKDDIQKMKDTLQKKGFKVLDECFGCKGHFGGIFNSNHPDEKDLNNAIQFANRAMAIAKAQ